MMKKVLAVAIASAFAAPAFAATANVDVYGVINVGFESVDNGVNDKLRLTTGNNSAIGFKGSEDLGGGMKANWQIETNVSIDGDSNATAGSGVGALNGTRNVWGGLSGGWGEVRAGVHDTPYKMSTGRLDTFVATIGDYNTLLGAVSGGGASGTFDLRTGNTVAYISPNMSGFQIAAAYVLSADDDFGIANSFDSSDAWSLSGTYSNGPLFLTAAYEKHNLDGGVASTSGGVVQLGNASAASNDRDAWKVGAGYKFGDFGIGAIYESIDVDNVGDRDAWFVTGDYTMGAFKFKVAYSTADDQSASIGGADMWAVGLDYTLSKRTMIQFTYADLDNDNNANYILGQGSNQVTGNAAGRDADGFGINMVHRF